jgi:hypothetical protein
MGALASKLLGAAATTNDSNTATDVTTRPAAISTREACQLVVDLLRRLAATRGERDVYRQMASVALTQLHEKDIALKHERDSRFRLLADYRAMRSCH